MRKDRDFHIGDVLSVTGLPRSSSGLRRRLQLACVVDIDN